MPNGKLGGLQLMCFIYASFKRIAPGQELGMDLQEPFLTALEMFQNGATVSIE